MGDLTEEIIKITRDMSDVVNNNPGSSFLKQISMSIENLNSHGYLRENFDVYLFKNVDGLKATTDKVVMYSSDVDSQINSQHGVDVITNMGVDYITKPVCISELGLLMGIANGAYGDFMAQKIIPFNGWSLSETDTLCACIERADDTFITFTSRVLHTVKELGLSTESIISVGNPMLELLDCISHLHSLSKSHHDIKIDNFLVLPPKFHKIVKCPNVKNNDDLSEFIEVVKVIKNSTDHDLFSIGLIDLAESMLTTPKLYDNYGRRMSSIYSIKTISLAIASIDLLHGTTGIEMFDHYATWLVVIDCGLILPLIAINNNGSLLRLTIILINDDLKNFLNSKFTFLTFLNKYIGTYFMNKSDLITISEICWDLKTKIIRDQDYGDETKALYLQLLTKTCCVGTKELMSVKPNTITLPAAQRSCGYATDEGMFLTNVASKRAPRRSKVTQSRKITEDEDKDEDSRPMLYSPSYEKNSIAERIVDREVSSVKTVTNTAQSRESSIGKGEINRSRMYLSMSKKSLISKYAS